MRTVAIAVAAAVLLAGASLSPAAPPVTNTAQLEARLEQLRTDVKIPAFSAAIARGDRIVWAKGFGLADIEHSVAATPKTQYHLASLTKTFASTVIMQLVEQGKLDLDAPVSNYGVKIEGDQPVCVKHLLSHTSGGVPGTQYSYDGNRFALLSDVVEAASGSTFAQLVCRRIIEPLALTQTAPNPLDEVDFPEARRDREAFAAQMARPYQLAADGRTFELIEYRPHFNCSAGLVSTVLDVAKFSIALDQHKLISQESLDKVTTKTVAPDGRRLPYGLGWFVFERGDLKLVWHYGLWVGDSALIIKAPDRQLTFVVLANSDRLTGPYFHGRGELLTSPFARTFVEAFVTGNAELPEDPIDQ